MTKRQPYRVQRNAARAELRACRAELAELQAAARNVVDNWSSGDLAAAVAGLEFALEMQGA